MKQKKYGILLLCLLSLTVQAESYTGKIGNKLKVKFSLENKDGQVSGFYYYERVGVDIELVGRQNGKSLELYELDYKKDTVATISATVSKRGMSGFWTNAATKKCYPLTLQSTKDSIRSLPLTINGIYVDKSCSLNLRIYRSKGEYVFKLMSAKQTWSGKVNFSRDEDLYVILKGIEWAESDSEGKGESNFDVDCLVGDEELIIQNAGNAMNFYVKLPDCVEKYIHLKKEYMH